MAKEKTSGLEERPNELGTHFLPHLSLFVLGSGLQAKTKPGALVFHGCLNGISRNFKTCKKLETSLDHILISKVISSLNPGLLSITIPSLINSLKIPAAK